MAKTKRLIKAKLPTIDIVFELVDARAPKASQNPELKDIIGNKPRLILLNKADLADGKALDKWIEQFRSEGADAMKINALTGQHVRDIVPKSKSILKDLFQKEKERGRKERPIRALIVGIPNVGKSTLINRLVGKKTAKVGDTPGITRHLQMIRVQEDLALLDTPGILWPDLDDQQTALKLALLGTIKDHLIPADEVAIYGIDVLRRHYRRAFEERYDISIEETDGPIEIFDKIGRRRGALTRGSEIDYDRVIELFLYDFRHQRFGSVILEKAADTDV